MKHPVKKDKIYQWIERPLEYNIIKDAQHNTCICIVINLTYLFYSQI